MSFSNKFIVFISLLSLTAHAQNIVPNSSFEIYKKDPCAGRFRTGQESIGDYINDWYVPTNGTTDLYDSLKVDYCIIYSYYKNPHTGRYLTGIFTCYFVAPGATTYNDPDYREYLQVKLSKPLTPGRIYQTSFFAALLSFSGQRTNNLGLLFTVDPVGQKTGKSLIRQTPQVVDNTVLADTVWHQIRGEFVADKPYQYLTFGNFMDDAHTIIQPTGKNPYLGPGAYYYIDDVTVEAVSDAPLVAVPNLGTDTTLCLGQSITIHLPDNPQTRYRWQDGSLLTIRTITQSGTYVVAATTGAYTLTDTLRVVVVPPLRLPSDTLLCQGEQLTLTPNYAVPGLLWNTGSTDSTLKVSQAGQFWVSAPNRYCTLSDTINVQVVDCLSTVPNVFTPNGDGKNEAFVVENIGLRSWRLAVYNRWGKQVFESEPYHNEWQGDGLPAGFYYYELYCESLRRRAKGWVEILR